MGKWVKTSYYGTLMFYFYTIKIDYTKKLDIFCVSTFVTVFAVIPMVIMVNKFVRTLLNKKKTF